MESPNKPENAAELSRAPRIGVRLMIAIFIGLVLVAIYANVQKVRRDKIERTTVLPAATVISASPSPGRD